MPVGAILHIMYFTLSWNELHVYCCRLAQTIKKADFDPEVIVTVAKGGLTIAHIIACHLDLPVTSFTVSTYEGMQKRNEPVLTLGAAPEIANKRVLLLDDIADTGATLTFGIDYVRQFSPAAIHTAALFLKPTSSIQPEYFAKEVTEWVIFPFEITETLDVYRKLQETSPEEAERLKAALERLDLPKEVWG